MKRLLCSKNLILITICVLVMLIGCGSERTSPTSTDADKGSVEFEVDLESLSSSLRPSTKGKTYTINDVFVNLTHPSEPSVSIALQIVDNTARGTIENLEQGYWTVNAYVSGDDGTYFEAEVEVNIQAGITVGCTLLFDPAKAFEAQGSLAITVGINPVPEFKRLPDFATQDVLISDNEILVVDTSNTIITYDINFNLTGEHNLSETIDYMFPHLSGQPIIAASYNYEKTGLYIVYANGEFILFNFETSQIELIPASIYPEIESIHLEMVSPQYLMINTKALYSSAPAVSFFDVTNSYLGSETLLSPGLDSVCFNESTMSLYHMVEAGSEIYDIESYVLDPGGMLFDFRINIYMCANPNGAPLKSIKNNSRVVAPAGDLFAPVPFDNVNIYESLTREGSIGIPYIDIISDDVNKYLYLISDAENKQLIVMDDINYSVVKGIDLPDKAYKILQNTENIYIFAEHEGADFCRLWNKAELLSTGVNLN